MSCVSSRAASGCSFFFHALHSDVCYFVAFEKGAKLCWSIGADVALGLTKPFVSVTPLWLPLTCYHLWLVIPPMHVTPDPSESSPIWLVTPPWTNVTPTFTPPPFRAKCAATAAAKYLGLCGQISSLLVHSNGFLFFALYTILKNFSGCFFSLKSQALQWASFKTNWQPLQKKRHRSTILASILVLFSNTYATKFVRCLQEGFLFEQKWSFGGGSVYSSWSCNHAR